MPTASTISRRMRTESLAALAERLLATLNTQHLVQQVIALVAVVDGKALPIGPHSHDRQASWGRSTSGKAKGSKLHAIVTTDGRVLAWRVAPIHIDERVMARRMLRKLGHSGSLLADGNYDSNTLFDAALERGIPLLGPRRGAPSSGLSHLPARGRLWRRVRNWVAGKLILHAACAANRREALMQ